MTINGSRFELDFESEIQYTKRLMEQKETINRRGFGLKQEILPLLAENYHSSLIDQIKASHYELQAGSLTICLAEEFGFCYGVDRAVDLAYETRKRFPDRKIYLTSEIIHNPRVNSKLHELGIEFLKGNGKSEDAKASLDLISKNDVVLIPAFGTPTDELEVLKSKGALLVDTTCGSVVAVWRRVERYAEDGFTAVIHGKFDHEETQATSSRATQYPNGRFIVVRDKAQTQKICDFILGKLDSKPFLKEFKDTASPGFDPERDLQKVGCANQTTMLSSDSLEIAEMIQSAIRARYGTEEVPNRFRHFDTICSATQDRQDAVLKLARSGVNLMMVVGGYNSSNTGHLCEISSEFCPAFHVQDAEEIISRDAIRHKPAGSSKVITSQSWLPEGPIRIGVTAGASTPNRVIEEVILKIISCAGF
ncbi:MAG: 4-hydroxy-3-methylbut-2-enyl diphosphate reductase [Omnitrophica bacterium RIFCSPHIGHO2_02_FULL_46_11]|nr:MAG: 4-hydroxy-3-methylbut-2-enyl diphosphate reductase [Omnitrophica bacterium RIFCSPLOWO2_01_FULL_45_10b]OGW84760.1 MAG: 4-hydroxy-3-methylbut-2-enyl diphosphate reductase [Omnitrophica bacterium RIFCSPHIGHO2_02_FULL_46_11]